MPLLKSKESNDQKKQDKALKDRKSTAVAVPTVAKLTGAKLAGPEVSRLRKVGRAIARHPRLTQTALLFAIISGTSLFLLYSLFKGAWSPEQDNLKILHTIFKMEMGRESTLPIDEDSQQVITRSFQSLEPYVEADGWIWINRFGSTITYGKQEERLIASCSTYSPLYMICSLSEIP